ncbi:MAG: hypothetical protein MJ000_11070 [Bacteroidales bacterium]|nr:hypothetical protein [Bacteroidales bacterium]
MKNDYAKRQQAMLDKAYRDGHAHGLTVAIDLSKMAFLVAMNKELGIGKERFDKVLRYVNGVFVNHVIEDPEHTRYKLEKECERIMECSAEEFLQNWRI